MWEYNCIIYIQMVFWGLFISFKVISGMVYDSYFLCPRYMQHMRHYFMTEKKKLQKYW